MSREVPPFESATGSSRGGALKTTTRAPVATGTAVSCTQAALGKTPASPRGSASTPRSVWRRSLTRALTSECR